ncbi:PRC-barrel domain containing protein [Halobaculum halobium]|uniref:PRC-barrel domain containing protein n=1 Tax=Halobaculum halobium TaxID=3032281 RepID=A0ABD5TBL3_9EURY|nr:PRC-barrel domain containing protein [Halobaculum sp. SYNS20]
MERNHVTEDDEGKAVLDSGGRKIGMVTEVKSGTAYVNADPGLADSIRSKLGWGDADEGDYALENDRIDTVTDDEIRLKDGS